MKNSMKVLSLALAILLGLTACSQGGKKVANGDIVKVEYSAFLQDGKQFDTTEGKQPLTFMIGSKQVLDAFEKEVVGLNVGSTKKFTIKASEAYGEKDPKKLVTLPRDERFPKDLELKEGSVIFANRHDDAGKVVQQVPVKINKIDGEEVTLDYNHPLAGEDLTYEVKIIEIVNSEDLQKKQEAAKADGQAKSQEAAATAQNKAAVKQDAKQHHKG